MSSLKIIELTENNTCKICDNAIGKYSCPRCNILYCSLPCYQSSKHLECSESFYKESVLEHIDKSDQKSKEKMTEILQKFHEQNKIPEGEGTGEDCDEDYEDIDEDYVGTDSDDEIGEMFKDLGERLAGIDLDNSEDVWENLNNDERQEFEAFLMSGDVSKYIPMWTPWWEYGCQKRIIEVTELDEHKSLCPKILENIKPFSEISSKPPASCVQYNMMNIIAAYAFILRYFNGDHMEFPKETSSYIFNLSLNLSKNQNFDTFNQAVQSITSQWTSNAAFGIIIDKENLNYVKPDVHMILSGPHATEQKYYLLCALSNLREIFDKAVKIDKTDEGKFYKKFTENQTSQIQMLGAEDLKKCVKKIDYFLSYAKFCYEEIQ